MKKISGDAFKPAHKVVKPDMYIESCMFDFCALDGKRPADEDAVICYYLAAYSKEAAEHGTTLKWRDGKLCPKQCPTKKIWSECLSKCSPTCSMPNRDQDQSCLTDCVPGCECPKGTYMDRGECVPLAECSCYHQRTRYKPGETIKQRCNSW